jgi:hypothetical protein
MSLPRLRHRVDAQTFADWRAVLPGLALPAWLDTGPDDGETGVRHTTRGVTVPPVVAAALALHGDPDVTMLFAVQDESLRTTGCVALVGGVASALVRSGPVGAAGWVEVACVPIERAVTEVLRWVPVRPRGRGTLEVQVIRAEDAAAGWVERWAACDVEGWRVAPDGGPVSTGGGEPEAMGRPVQVATLAAQLRFVLAGYLSMREAG